jgi:hypothetical protein
MSSPRDYLTGGAGEAVVEGACDVVEAGVGRPHHGEPNRGGLGLALGAREREERRRGGMESREDTRAYMNRKTAATDAADSSGQTTAAPKAAINGREKMAAEPRQGAPGVRRSRAARARRVASRRRVRAKPHRAVAATSGGAGVGRRWPNLN